MASSTVAIIIIAVTIAFFIWNKFPMSVVSMAGAVAMAMLVPEVELSAVYEGFSAQTVLEMRLETLGGLNLRDVSWWLRVRVVRLCLRL